MLFWLGVRVMLLLCLRVSVFFFLWCFGCTLYSIGHGHIVAFMHSVRFVVSFFFLSHKYSRTSPNAA